MWLLLITFLVIPVTYFLQYGFTSLQLNIYLTTFAAGFVGFSVMRYACSNYSFFSRADTQKLKQDVAEKMAILLLVTMLIVACIALVSIREMGDDYRAMFFTKQNHIFGFERFGFIFQILTEYAALAFFSIILTNSNEFKWKVYILMWAVLGSIITFGRWYIFYFILLMILSNAPSLNRLAIYRLLMYVSLSLIALVGGGLIFVCRGSECSISLDSILHGVVAGIGNYFYIPIEMVEVYKNNLDYGLNLFIGFTVYPFDVFGRITELYWLNYEYDKWGLEIQNYVNLENLGDYNALVGQPLTSFVAIGQVGVLIHYFCIGALSGICYYKSSQHHPLAMLSIIIAIVSFLIPSLSGPMLVTAIVFFIFFQKILIDGDYFGNKKITNFLLK